ncbi:hypothetical protein CMEL01_01159 [Colletotrichum melonis]|uniref:Uncharacterized protein n=1 Tax=Colletotrichum melonis TaxID=1209925 RepID=A0AAI9Y3F8_9PEZI|nr:hypothetical protein CMEL01_01159 [Colletotrichum melonis]
MDHGRTRRTLAKASQPLSEKDPALVGILKSRFRDATAQWQAAETPTRTASTGAPQTASRQWTPHTMTASHRAPKGKGIWLFRTMPTWDVLARTRSRARFEQCMEYDWLFPLPPFLSDSWAFFQNCGMGWLYLLPRSHTLARGTEGGRLCNLTNGCGRCGRQPLGGSNQVSESSRASDDRQEKDFSNEPGTSPVEWQSLVRTLLAFSPPKADIRKGQKQSEQTKPFPTVRDSHQNGR